MITGTQFNEQFKGTRFVKLTNESCCHNEYQYKEGLNADTLEFDPDVDCKSGGFYFCRYDDFGKWTNYGNCAMHYVWDVKIPDNAKVSLGKDKIKCNKFIITNKTCIWNNKKLCLEAVKQDGYTLQYVKEQTPELCLEAVKQDGYALYFVEEQTPELCLEVVKNNKNALQCVNEEFKPICQEYLNSIETI